MTVQVNDDVTYKDKKYILIDVEKNKQIIVCANFIMPKKKSFVVNSGCWRGYKASYYIINQKLYGIRYESDFKNQISSEKLAMNYTGSCIIAGGNENLFLISDFLECYLDFDEAYELHFTNGLLDEEINLDNAITTFRKIESSIIYQSAQTTPYERASIRESFARKYLKYAYDLHSYKWRKPEIDSCES